MCMYLCASPLEVLDMYYCSVAPLYFELFFLFIGAILIFLFFFCLL